MKQIEVVAGVLTQKPLENASNAFDEENHARAVYLATQRGYGDYKGFWEFPGGKVESGETHERALVRELREELSVEVRVGEFICTVEHDYPTFHLTMHCFFCCIEKGNLTLLEHESAKWISRDELSTLQWCPADIKVVEALSKY